MNSLQKIFLLFVFFSLFLIDGIGQSIGYSLSTSLPVTKEFPSYPGSSFKYKRSFEVSGGISLFNSTSNRIWNRYDIQARFSWHNSLLKVDGGSLQNFRITEHKASKLILDLELFYFEQYLFKDLVASIGMKNSILLNANRYSTEEEAGTINRYEDTSISEVNVYKLDVLLKVNWRSFKISNSFYLKPSYVLGYNLINDFKNSSENTRFLNHRFGLVLYKKTSQ